MFGWGFYHIIAWDATDHLLFILCLCAGLSIPDYARVLRLTIVFAIGHSIPIFFQLDQALPISQNLVEIAIAATIAITAVISVLYIKKEKTNRVLLLSTAIFGFIHGLGFSSAYSMLRDHATHFDFDILAFSAGIETAQILVVSGILIIHYLLSSLKIQLSWIRVVELSAAGCISIFLMCERIIN